MSWSHLTIRARITGGSLLIALFLSIAVGVIIYHQVERIVEDDQVRVLDGIEGPYLTAILSGDTEELDPPGPGQLVAVIDPSGAVAIDTLPGGLAPGSAAVRDASDGVKTVAVGADTFLMKTQTISAEDGSWQVTTAMVKDDRVLNEVAFLLTASIAGLNIAFGAAAWLIGSAALRPVAVLRRSAAELVSQSGGELLPVGPVRDEIAELATTLNELIEKLRASAERERQIVSDASHEFRTPLAVIQTRLELAQRHAASLEEMRAEVSAAQRTLTRLSSLATSMLELSRIDSQTTPGRASVGEIAIELAEAADRARQRAAGRPVRIEYEQRTRNDDGQVAVGVADFGRVCDNLTGNALAALSGSGRIDLRLDEDDGSVRLTVADDAGGMDAVYVPFAFDRFSQQDAARTGSGAGLGLPIVAGIAAMSGGAVALDNSPGVGLRVEVSFPLIPGQ